MSQTTAPPPAASGFADRSLGEIATALPVATAVFRRHRLDFCCGGLVSLAEAAAAKNLSVAAIEAELAAVADAQQSVALPDNSAALTDLIETRYHAAHRADLPELVRLARRVEAVHRSHPAVPAGLADLLENLSNELEAHMRKEEQVLFPLIRQGGHPMIAQPIAAMLAEHDDHGAYLRLLEERTGNFAAPADACGTWRALYAGCRSFTDALMEHVHIENNVLFPRFAAR
ncbi:MAG TPA: iron-sulfur cluster repair protein YtfE [Acetobacteraceae bacterium]